MKFVIALTVWIFVANVAFCSSDTASTNLTDTICVPKWLVDPLVDDLVQFDYYKQRDSALTEMLMLKDEQIIQLVMKVRNREDKNMELQKEVDRRGVVIGDLRIDNEDLRERNTKLKGQRNAAIGIVLATVVAGTVAVFAQ